jgi:hypothetical protein
VNAVKEAQKDENDGNKTSNARENKEDVKKCTQLVHAALSKLACEKLSDKEDVRDHR